MAAGLSEYAGVGDTSDHDSSDFTKPVEIRKAGQDDVGGCDCLYLYCQLDQISDVTRWSDCISSGGRACAGM